MDLTAAVNKIMMEYIDSFNFQISEFVEHEVAKEAVQKLNKTSPYNPKSSGHKGVHYRNDWYVTNGKKKYVSHVIIASRQYQLTHLLEFGHDVIAGGRKVGSVKGQPHIKAVEQWAIKEAVEGIAELSDRAIRASKAREYNIKI